MEKQLLSKLLKQLYSYPNFHLSDKAPCYLRSYSRINGAKISRRFLSGLGHGNKPEIEWQQRIDSWSVNKDEEFKRYPMVNANQLRSRRERPRRVKMLTREFIEDSLYNPSYGYFSKHVVIFTPESPFDFNSLKDEPAFYKLLGEQYIKFEDELDVKEPNEARQLWHTPTELFKPYYGEAIARYLITNYKLIQYPYDDLIIYEMGAGNGTLMMNILDYIRNAEPSVYDRTKFKIIEISSSLAKLQQQNLLRTANARGHSQRVEIINKSIFEWDQLVPSPCYFLAMEVFDNFAHDCIRYDPTTEEPLQGSVLIDSNGEFYDFYSRDVDPIAARFLRVRHAATGGRYPQPLHEKKLARRLMKLLPFEPNLSDPEFIPTRVMQFFDILEKYFPCHKLVMGDFHTLPNTIKGVNAPVVQTRYKRRTVPVEKLFVHQGYFDILFPTNFNVIESIYRALTGKLTRVLPQRDFLRKWAKIEETQTKSGENPLLTWYKNTSVLTTD